MGNCYSNYEKEKELKLFDLPGQLTSEMYKVISYKQSKSLCQIITARTKSIGFLCNIPNPVLITSNHTLNENQIRPGEQIKISFTDENENKIYKIIKIDEKRATYTIGSFNGEEIDTTIIELRPDEDKLDNQMFLEIDEELMSDDVKDIYKTKNIYLIDYKEGEGINISTGVINEIKKNNKKYTLLYTCDTRFFWMSYYFI